MSKRKIQQNDEDIPSKSRRNVEDEDENASDEYDSDFEGLQDSEEDSAGEELCDEDAEDEEDSEQEDVQIEFCAFNPEKEDFHGLKQLLDRLWLSEKVTTSKIADFIIEKQSDFATLLRQVDDDAPEVEEKKPKPFLKPGEAEEELEEDDFDQVYSLLTIIPFNDHFTKESPEVINNLKEWILTKLPENSPKDKINTKLAFMISERFINIPTKASIPCYEALLKDIENNSNYKFDNILMLIKLVKDKESKKEIIYTNPEEELFDENADYTYEYSVADQCDPVIYDWMNEKKHYEPFRKIILISKDKWINVIKSLPNECQ